MEGLWGTIVNVIAVLVGGAIGLLLNKGVPEKLTGALMTGVGFCVLYIGIDGCLAGENTLVAILSVVLGAVVGTLLDLDARLKRLGDRVEARFSKGESGSGRLAQGFVSASLLFCVGTMAIVGSLQSGLQGNHEMLYLKSLLDLISSVVFGATLGAGVMLSVFTVFVYQGSITLLAQVVAPYLADSVIAEMNCVGSLLIIGLALNLLKVTDIKVANFVPAVFFPILLCPLYQLVF
ncbi:MAG: DUF554 domain-containing protein [Clostridia bacterium]|nr:DUF554 domain-containing protein [Clostridia bacterium]